MRLSQMRDTFISQLTFPVRRSEVVDQLGGVEIDPPTGEPETVSQVLERTDQSSFRSPDELYDAMVSLLGDQYVGRKYYDDRGANAGIDSEEAADTAREAESALYEGRMLTGRFYREESRPAYREEKRAVDELPDQPVAEQYFDDDREWERSFGLVQEYT